MPQTYTILLAKVVTGVSLAPAVVDRDLGLLARTAGAVLQDKLVEPFTITPGAGFHGVLRSPGAAVRALLYFEKLRLRFRSTIALNVAVVEAGLSEDSAMREAEALLTRRVRGLPRFQFQLADAWAARQLEDLFFVLDGISSRWKPVDYRLIQDLLSMERVVEIAARHRKERGQIYKRRTTLQTEEYRRLRDLIDALAERMDG